MTFLNLYVLIILIIYLAAFFIQNLKTYFSVRQSIRGRSGKLTLSLILSSVIYLMTFGLIAFPALKDKLIFITFLELPATDISGAVLMMLAMIIGVAALYEMKNSWRVGIKHDQKTKLVTTGIYHLSRNPYFLSYNLLFIGIFLIFPSILLLASIITLMIIFHFMILDEENYLAKVQGEMYLKYKKKTARYLILYKPR